MSTPDVTTREQVVATFTQHLLELDQILAASVDPELWVLSNQGFYIALTPGGGVKSCGILAASRFDDTRAAHALARQIRNGNGFTAEVIRLEAAIRHERDELAQAIAQLVDAPKGR